LDNLTKKFGTAPVFFTAISTILGAIMFLRFGFSVGNVGLAGTFAIIIIGHVVTIPTAMAIAEIATNQKVEGGGEYYIISRSFGLVIGSAIGITLYLSQAISVAFYIMAFTEAFTSLFDYFINNFALPLWLEWLLLQKQTVGIPALLLLTSIMLTKGASLGVQALYIVVATLAVSLVAFFVGTTEYSLTHSIDFFADIGNTTQIGKDLIVNTKQAVQDSVSVLNQFPTIEPSKTPANPGAAELPVSFFTVFAIIFPAFTGMTAGVGLSGDLKDPGKSIPLGTLSATIFGMIIYFFIAYKLAISSSPQDLADTSKLVMADIAWQGWWLIPLGLAAATISSALGSIMVAPRTLQAIAKDRIFPSSSINYWLSRGKGKSDEPFNASVVTIIIAGAFILLGALDSVAEVISMFFMVTYGSLCLISFLQHFAADPSYRPKFKSKWYFSLFGALACFGLMFFMNAGYAVIALIMMVGLYVVISLYNPDKKTLAVIFQGVIFQFSRQLQVFLQKAEKENTGNWRPSAIALSENSFERISSFDLLRWISQKYGFGTYIHMISGYLSRQSSKDARICKNRLIKMAESTESNIYVDTLISPSFTSAVAQVIQLPGIAGTENNLLIFEFSKNDPSKLEQIVDNFKLIKSIDFDVIILGSSERGYGLKKQIHIWITANDYENANLMILLGYIINGHKDWKGSEIKIFSIHPGTTIAQEKEKLYELIQNGQLPISPQNISFQESVSDQDTRHIICDKSKDADLTIVGFRDEAIKHDGKAIFSGYGSLGNVVFVNAAEQKKIK
jgi:amino acid transporter